MDIVFAEKVRRWIGWGLAAGVAGAIAWSFSPGMPVLWGPKASESTKQSGLALFNRNWQSAAQKAEANTAIAEEVRLAKLNVGPVFNASSCVACHCQGGVGGAGPNTANVIAFEVLPTVNDPRVHSGTVHRFASDASVQESADVLHNVFPTIKGGTRVFANCRLEVRDFDPVRFLTVSTPPLFGLGWIDRIPAQAISHHSFQRGLKETVDELGGDFHARVPMGRYRLLDDGRIGKFGWKAQFATLEEFVGAACANELGLSNPVMEQAKPLAMRNAANAEKPAAHVASLSKRDFRAMLGFIDTLPRPVESLPAEPGQRAAAVRGKRLFASVGCAECHTPEMAGVKGVYSDFLLHRLDDRGPGGGGGAYGANEVPVVPLPAEHPDLDEWKTPPLWGVADSAPYFHDGRSATLELAIERHRGDAKVVTEAYKKLPPEDQGAIVTFLKTLKAPPDAVPAPPEALEELASLTAP